MKYKNITAGIIGGAGYTGGEAVRLLLNHPQVQLAFVHSRSNTGAPLYSVHTDLLGETELTFASELSEVDILFLCVGHGEAKKFLEQNPISDDTKIIDLSQDFRLAANVLHADRTFVYGLPEQNKEQIKIATAIANPGCFATAIQLALLPLANKGLLNDVHATGITGSTGAGQKLQASSHFSWRENNIEAYKSLKHQHLDEIMETLNSVQSGAPAVNFMPWRGDFTRGIYVSAYTTSTLDLNTAYKIYQSYYKSSAFTHVSRTMINLKQVVNTNKCLLHLEKAGDKLIVHSAIDNLLKGASGQAVQNMNLMFGFPEEAGLKLKATAF
jgi:N-acetyl-gamma-glutamyl-phosphate reductase